MFLSLDSGALQKIKMLDTEKLPVTLTSNVDAMNLSFLLCPSGMYLKFTIGCTYIGQHSFNLNANYVLYVCTLSQITDIHNDLYFNACQMMQKILM